MSPEFNIYITCLLARLGDLPGREGRKIVRVWVMDGVKETIFAGYSRARHTQQSWQQAQDLSKLQPDRNSSINGGRR